MSVPRGSPSTHHLGADRGQDVRPEDDAPQVPGDVAAATVDPGDELLADEAALGEAHRCPDHPAAGLGRDGRLIELGAHRRPPGLDPDRLVGVRPHSPHPVGNGDGRSQQIGGRETGPVEQRHQFGTRTGHRRMVERGHLRSAQRDALPVEGLDLGVDPEAEPVQPCRHRLAEPALDVDHQLVGGAGARPGATPASRRRPCPGAGAGTTTPTRPSTSWSRSAETCPWTNVTASAPRTTSTSRGTRTAPTSRRRDR